MAIDPSEFDELFQRFEKLNSEEQQELLDELQHRKVAAAKPQENGRTLFDAFNERGMLGSISGPPDWSTNPKYMEGFGQDDNE